MSKPGRKPKPYSDLHSVHHRVGFTPEQGGLVKQAAADRGIPVATLIREATMRDVTAELPENAGKHEAPFVPSFGGQEPMTEKRSRPAVDDTKVTPGPWRGCIANDGNCDCGLVWSMPADAVVCSVNTYGGANNQADAAFICLARNTHAEREAVVEAARRLHGPGCRTPEQPCIAAPKWSKGQFCERCGPWFDLHRALSALDAKTKETR